MKSTGQPATTEREQTGAITEEERALYKGIAGPALVFGVAYFTLPHFVSRPVAAALSGALMILAAWVVGDRRGWRGSFKWALLIAIAFGICFLVLATAFDRYWPAS